MSSATVLLIVLAGIIAAGLAFAQYYWGKRQPQWGVLSALRFVTYFGVLLLLINPKFHQQHYILKKPKLILAIDNSKSISELGEATQIRQFVNTLQNNHRLKENFDIQSYTFGTDFKPADSLGFTEGQTNINAVFTHLQQLNTDQRAPTVLITDGNQTFGPNYEFSAQQYEQPIYPVVVGDTNSYRDLKISRLNANPYAFLHNEFPVEVFVNYKGKTEVSRLFTISQNGQVLFRQMLHFSPDRHAFIIQAQLKANTVGVQTYEAAIKALDNEKNKTNNQWKFAVEVIDQKTKVLLLSAFPHPDLGSMKAAIESNPQRQADIKYTEKDEIDFGAYQLIVLYQPNSSFETAYKRIDQLDLNTLTVTGTATDYKFLNRQQDFFHKAITHQTENYLPVYNPGYPSFQFEDIGFADFPPLLDQFGTINMKTAYHPLLFQAIDGIKMESPLLATVEKGKRRFGFLFGSKFWQWRAKSYRLSGAFEDFDQFFGKLIQYLASNKRRQRLTVNHASFYNSGERIVLQAHYFDENYVFDPRAEVYAILLNKETREKQRLPFLLKMDRYELDLSNLEPGNYKFTVKVNGKSLSKSGEFTILDFDVEKQFKTANVEQLKRISNQGLYFPGKANELIDRLLADDAYKPIQKAKTQSAPLIDWWYLLGIIALSLSTEWFIRKYKGLI